MGIWQCQCKHCCHHWCPHYLHSFTAPLPWVYSTTYPPSTLPFYITIFPQQHLPAMSPLAMLSFMMQNLPPQCCIFMMKYFPSIFSSPHVISFHPLPFRHVQSSVIRIVHVELTYHKDKQFIGDLNSSMATPWITVLELDWGGQGDFGQELPYMNSQVNSNFVFKC